MASCLRPLQALEVLAAVYVDDFAGAEGEGALGDGDAGDRVFGGGLFVRVVHAGLLVPSGAANGRLMRPAKFDKHMQRTPA